MKEKKKFYCPKCNSEWEVQPPVVHPICPDCGNTNIIRSLKEGRYSRRSRQKVRWSGSLKR